MICTTLRNRALFPAVALVIAGYGLPARAVNLLSNPGFEYPQNVGSESTANPSDWVFTTSGGEIERENFENNTPGGVYSIWPKEFEAGSATAYQTFTDGVVGNTPYTFSGYWYFQSNFNTTDAVVDVELSFFSSTTLSSETSATATYIYASSQAQSDDSAWAAGNGTTFAQFVNPPTGAFTQYSVTATAPAGTKMIAVSFDYDAANATSGPTLSGFADDGDLEGAGNPPSVPTWSVDSSGDWNNTANWNTFTVPNGVGAAAQFEGAISANRNVYTDVPVTVGSMLFNSPNKYVIDGAGSITLQAASGNATVTVQAGTQEINLPLTLASSTVLNVSSGATLVMADPISINSGLTLTQTGSGTVTYESTITVGSSSSIAFGNSTHAHALTLQSSSSASIGGTGTVLTLDSLSLASGAKLDIGKGQVDLPYTGASPASTIAGELKTAYASGTWSGNGITSSSASFSQGTSVGYYDTGTQVNIERTWIGDLNLDGIVNSADMAAMGTAGGGWQHGDLNYDGVVNADDYALFAYGSALSGGRSISSVPEPGVGALLIFAALLPRRHRI
jgi:hypothetical protein